MPEQEKIHQEEPVKQKLTNADFRKLLMTPRTTPVPTNAVPIIKHTSSSHNKPQERLKTVPLPSAVVDDKAEKRRKKKSYYAKLKKQEEDKMAELAERYRDRSYSIRNRYYYNSRSICFSLCILKFAGCGFTINQLLTLGDFD